MYKILKMEGRAKRAHMETVHGNIETPVFMNVGTAAAIKGAVSTEDLQQIGTQVELLQHVPPPRASGRRGRKEDGRTPQVYGLG